MPAAGREKSRGSWSRAVKRASLNGDCENLAMENERIHWLTVSAVNADYEMNAVVIPMKDAELFLRGENVPMTKEAVRALALSKLEPTAPVIT